MRPASAWVFALSLFTTLLSNAAETRTWTDASGNHAVEAAFESLNDGMVYLRTADGRRIQLAVNRLSEADRALIATLSAKDASPEDLKKSIDRQRYAKDVVAMLERALKDPAVPKAYKDHAAKELPRWKELALVNAIQYGGAWRKPAEIEVMRSEAKSLIEQASRLISVGSNGAARQSLLKASKMDPESVQADFTLGLLHALVGANPEAARQRFLVCVRRMETLGAHRTALQNANLKAAINNMAITEVRLARDNAAIKLWSGAVESGRIPPELIQNLGRYSALAADGGFVSVPAPTIRTIGLLYAKAAAENDSREFDPGTGWLYIPYVAEAKEQKDENRKRDDEAPAQPGAGRVDPAGTRHLRVVGSGSGFAVATDLVVTNRHVAEDAEAFQISGGDNNVPVLSGEVVALCDSHDLALLRFAGLGATPLIVNGQLPRLSAAIRVLGYPESDVLGNSLKVTGGDVSGLPNADGGGFEEVTKMILLDATANPGNSGGPVIDITGTVIGVLTLGVNLKQSYSAAVPAPAAREFLHAQGVINDLEAEDLFAASNPSEAKIWEDVVERAGKSTYQILIMGSSERPAWVDRKRQPGEEAPQQPADWNGLEDPWCMHCNGLATIRCPRRNCRNGVIVGRDVEIIRGPVGNAGRTIMTQTDCPTCNGRGRIACPYCSNGFDPRL